MSVFKSTEVSRSLNRKGFVANQQSHHVYFRLVHDGTPTEAVTYMRHGDQEINDYLQSRMAKQLGLRIRTQLEELRPVIQIPVRVTGR